MQDDEKPFDELLARIQAGEKVTQEDWFRAEDEQFYFGQFQQALKLLRAGKPVEVEPLVGVTVLNDDPETKARLANIRVVSVLAQPRGMVEPPKAYTCCVTVEQARKLLAEGARWIGATTADPRNV